MSPSDLTLVARHVMKLLVERRFTELEEATSGTRLSADDMEAAVDDVGAALVLPPEHVWPALDVLSIRNWPDAYTVRFDLWTRNGRSDWTVELTVHSKEGRPVIEVDDIHPR
jgi:hypothetical protein